MERFKEVLSSPFIKRLFIYIFLRGLHPGSFSVTFQGGGENQPPRVDEG